LSFSSLRCGRVMVSRWVTRQIDCRTRRNSSCSWRCGRVMAGRWSTRRMS